MDYQFLSHFNDLEVALSYEFDSLNGLSVPKSLQQASIEGRGQISIVLMDYQFLSHFNEIWSEQNILDAQVLMDYQFLSHFNLISTSSIKKKKS